MESLKMFGPIFWFLHYQIIFIQTNYLRKLCTFSYLHEQSRYPFKKLEVFKVNKIDLFLGKRKHRPKCIVGMFKKRNRLIH